MIGNVTPTEAGNRYTTTEMSQIMRYVKSEGFHSRRFQSPDKEYLSSLSRRVFRLIPSSFEVMT